jgi:arylsulfatase A-like enzyme
MDSTRRQFVGSLGALSAASAQSQERAAARRPNVLFIISDQWSPLASDLAGTNRMLHTPAADSLAASGVRFGNAYCTFPLCSPSRVSLFSGRMPHETGVLKNVGSTVNLPPNSSALGELFAEAGYATGYFGKEHTGGVAYRGIQEFGNILFKGPGHMASGAVLDTVFTRDAIEFIRKPRHNPFFAVVSLINPHDIGTQPPRALLPGKSIVEICSAFDYQPGKYMHGYEFPPLVPNFNALSVSACPPTAEQAGWSEREWRRFLATYYLLMENTDWMIARLLATLRESGLEDNTLILFTADHGEQMGAHRRVGKEVFFQECTRVPLAISWKGFIKPGQVDNGSLVSGIDVLPTLCDYAGIRIPEGLPGRSIRPLLEKKNAPWREYLVAEINENRMLRSGRHKYMLYGREQPVEFLFDLENDPGETRDLAEDAGARPVLERSRDMLASWMKATGDRRLL